MERRITIALAAMLFLWAAVSIVDTKLFGADISGVFVKAR